MDNVNRTHTAPIAGPRTIRVHDIAVLTSLPAGKMAPVAAIPLLREDAMRANISINCEMLETTELLMNPVNMRVTAYLVPFLALERFEGSRDQFDRSFMGEPKVAGGAVVPWVETAAAGTYGANAVYKTLGLHAKATDLVNTAYLEAYNAVWNFRAVNRSKEITPRARLATDLAPAFWPHSRFAHVVPDFDQAVIDGEIALNVVGGHLAVKGPGGATKVSVTRKASSTNPVLLKAAANGSSFGFSGSMGHSSASAMQASGSNAQIDPNGTLEADLAGFIAELSAGTTTVSLSNLELARKTQYFAMIRQKYEGIEEEWIIDMLMNRLSIPDQAMKQPILLADRSVRFAQAKRYATDAANLSQSAVSGAAFVKLTVRVPQINTGGVVMVFVECVPDQLFERQRDPFFFTTAVDQLPEFLRDTLDPEKVDIVTNGEIDTAHASPALTFGYAPMNWKWTAWGPRVGGKFYRPSTNTPTDGVRQRIWAVEQVNPVLSSDFYIVGSGIHQKPFLDTVSDPFEVAAMGQAQITGNTVFGAQLIEATGNYDAVLAEAPQERIEKE